MWTFRWGAWMIHFKPRWMIAKRWTIWIPVHKEESHLTCLVHKNWWDPISQGQEAEPNCLPWVVITSFPTLTPLLPVCILGFLASRDCFPWAQPKECRSDSLMSHQNTQTSSTHLLLTGIPEGRLGFTRLALPWKIQDAHYTWSHRVGKCCLTQENK